ncbi:hypothetical protein VTJ04DRAFT_7966 [Mycothermus thermophilus]|uniref:uncharacterized protein n=1 Tax=Humicola insolens TaxID=85995 RepID=UPI00374323BF
MDGTEQVYSKRVNGRRVEGAREGGQWVSSNQAQSGPPSQSAGEKGGRTERGVHEQMTKNKQPPPPSLDDNNSKRPNNNQPPWIVEGEDEFIWLLSHKGLGREGGRGGGYLIDTWFADGALDGKGRRAEGGWESRVKDISRALCLDERKLVFHREFSVILTILVNCYLIATPYAFPPFPLFCRVGALSLSISAQQITAPIEKGGINHQKPRASEIQVPEYLTRTSTERLRRQYQRWRQAFEQQNTTRRHLLIIPSAIPLSFSSSLLATCQRVNSTHS